MMENKKEVTKSIEHVEVLKEFLILSMGMRHVDGVCIGILEVISIKWRNWFGLQYWRGFLFFVLGTLTKKRHIRFENLLNNQAFIALLISLVIRTRSFFAFFTF